MTITAVHTENYTLGKGKLYFDPWDTSDVPQGERFLGNCPSFSMTIESETLDHFSSKSGIAEKDDSATLSLTRVAAVTCDNMSMDNQALFVIGAKSTQSLTAGAITDQTIGPIVATDRYHQLGVLTAQPAGTRNISAVDDVSVKEGVNAIDWATGVVKAVGAVVVPTTGNDHWYMATAVTGTATTHASTEPTWPTDGSTVADNAEITWQDMGLIVLVEDTDFQVDLVLARIYVMTTGKIATFVPLLPAGITVNLLVDYTNKTTTWDEVASGSLTTTTGGLRFVADNPKGTNRDIYLPKVELSPDGEQALITGDDWAAMTFSVAVLTKDSSTQQVYIDGRGV